MQKLVRQLSAGTHLQLPFTVAPLIRITSVHAGFWLGTVSERDRLDDLEVDVNKRAGCRHIHSLCSPMTPSRWSQSASLKRL